MFQIGMNLSSRGCSIRSYPARGLAQPEHLGLLLALGMTSAMTRIESPVSLNLTEWQTKLLMRWPLLSKVLMKIDAILVGFLS